nr:His/Gly/Thr/Pro-type tRNA ligase C-terminal domain-containing protein [Candidatus Njordarchaeota archaeon]
MRRDKLPEKANGIYKTLEAQGFDTAYDEKGSAGKTYAKADEIGIPIELTVNYTTMEDHTVTIRDRDTIEQARIKVEELLLTLRKLIEGKLKLKEGNPSEDVGIPAFRDRS